MPPSAPTPVWEPPIAEGTPPRAISDVPIYVGYYAIGQLLFQYVRPHGGYIAFEGAHADYTPILEEAP